MKCAPSIGVHVGMVASVSSLYLEASYNEASVCILLIQYLSSLLCANI